jgi:hypothetical protein
MDIITTIGLADIIKNFPSLEETKKIIYGR